MSNMRAPPIEHQLRDLAWSLLAKLYPCKVCTFAFSDRGRKDVVFGVGAPELCEDCAMAREEKEGETWVQVVHHIPELLRTTGNQ